MSHEAGVHDEHVRFDSCFFNGIFEDICQGRERHIPGAALVIRKSSQKSVSMASQYYCIMLCRKVFDSPLEEVFQDFRIAHVKPAEVLQKGGINCAVVFAH